MTEAFPNVGHYRNLLSATADPNLKPRPTLEELHGDKVWAILVENHGCAGHRLVLWRS